jgi:hypothetical protein
MPPMPSFAGQPNRNPRRDIDQDLGEALDPETGEPVNPPTYADVVGMMSTRAEQEFEAAWSSGNWDTAENILKTVYPDKATRTAFWRQIHGENASADNPSGKGWFHGNPYNRDAYIPAT